MGRGLVETLAGVRAPSTYTARGGSSNRHDLGAGGLRVVSGRRSFTASGEWAAGASEQLLADPAGALFAGLATLPRSRR